MVFQTNEFVSLKLALFDFDGTVTKRDTLLPFLRYFVGNKRFVAEMAILSPVLVGYALRLIRNDVAKQIVLRRFIGGCQLKEIEQSGVCFARDRLPTLVRSWIIERIQWHRAQGHVCMLVSASLDVYLKPWAEATGFEALLCSRLIMNSDGSVTGELRGANCYGAEKAEQVTEWLDGRQPEYIYAYGDSRGDREMLAMADEGYLNGKLMNF